MKQQSSHQPTNNPPTTAQLAVFHGGQSALLAGAISMLVGVLQYLTSGTFDLKTLGYVLGSAFLGALSMIYKSVSSNPQLAQAAMDTAQEAIARLEQELPWMAADITRLKQAAISKQPTAVIPTPQPIVYPAPQAVRTSTPPASYTPNQSMLGTLNLNQQNADFLTSGPPAQQQSALSQLAQRSAQQGG